MKAAPVLLAGLTNARYVLADKGYDANALRKMLRWSAPYQWSTLFVRVGRIRVPCWGAWSEA